ncbi:MAG: hypothetical protein P4K93_13375, partial [Terracidiphilus sp.]|nr:hypothetical protein [Terracidiphilus sp.]
MTTIRRERVSKAVRLASSNPSGVKTPSSPAHFGTTEQLAEKIAVFAVDLPVTLIFAAAWKGFR